MGAKTVISVEEYLRTSYPGLDREYREGEVLERTMPDFLHSYTQGLLAGFLVALRGALKLVVCPELRVKLGPSRYLIPDIAVFHPSRPEQLVPDTPPFIVIEVLSPDDRMSEVLNKLEEYRQWGVPHIWLVDPHAKRMYAFDGALTGVPALRIPDLALEVNPTDIFE
jgi:Uma2 family endonuclease